MMLHPTQELEPPANPARFTCTALTEIATVHGERALTPKANDVLCEVTEATVVTPGDGRHGQA